MVKCRVHYAIGDKFNKLTVTGEPVAVWDEKHNRHRFFLPCKCDCGNTTLARKDKIRRTLSCGCAVKEALQRNHFIAQHGLSDTRLGYIWYNMIDRCEDTKCVAYPNYGGRGIRVCELWHDVREFSKWAIANGYRDDLTIDRIDNNGGYGPDNCRWVDMKTQANNRRNTIRLTAFGETKRLSEWATDPRCVVSNSTLRWRNAEGWDFETALTTPPVKGNPGPYKQRGRF